MCYQELVRLSIGNRGEILHACLGYSRRVAAQLCMYDEIQDLFMIWLLESIHEARGEVKQCMDTVCGVASTQVVQSLYHMRSEPKLSFAFMDPEAMDELTVGSLANMYDHC